MMLLTVLTVALCAITGITNAFQVSHQTRLHKNVPISNARSISSSSTRLNGLSMRWGLKSDVTANKITGDLEDGKTLRDTVPFELRGFSLPLVVFSIGTALTLSSFAGYFLDGGGDGGSVSSIGFVYGIPVFLIGLSLWYAEIKPVPVESSAAGDTAWEKFSTETFQKIKSDVTRHRYGDDAHLDSTLEALGLRLPQKKFPKLLSIGQAATADGTGLEFTLTFQSAETPYKLWNDPQRVRRYCKFFGPNVKAAVSKVDPDQRILALKLTTISEQEYQTLIDSPVEIPATAATSTSTSTAVEEKAVESVAATQQE